MSVQDTFPPQQQLVPSHELISERIGWQFSTWGTFLLVVAAWTSIQKDSLNLKLPVTAGALVLGLALIAYELRRRRNRAALCVRGFDVGIYRAGALATAAPRDQFVLFQPNYANSLVLVAGPLLLGALGLLPLFDLFNPLHDKPATADVLAGLAFTAAGASSAVSAFWTRHVWLTFLLPGKWLNDSFYLTRADAKRLTG